MASAGSSASFPRVSDAERERALDVLREGVAEGRVSHDTFMRRVEQVLTARRLDQLHAVLGDLPGRAAPAARGGWLVTAVARAVTIRGQVRSAWADRHLPQLVLPAAAPLPLTIGRATGCMLRLNHASVSRRHAELLRTGLGWTLCDLGSANGTWVNGCRVAGAIRVVPGDRVGFGSVAFRLTAGLNDT